jgi:CBS domain-containing protein
MEMAKDLRKKSSSTPDVADAQHKSGLSTHRKVEELMTNDVATITPESTLYESARLMGEKQIGSLVVMKYDTPVGIITERDLLGVVSSGIDLEKDWLTGGVSIKEEKVEKFMSHPIIKRCATSTVKDAARTMIENRIRRLAVCDCGKLVGIITASDMIRSLPEIPENMKVWFEVDYFMTKRVITADEETVVDRVAKIMAENRVGSVIITRQEEPIGIFTERDLLTKFLAKDKSLITEVGKVCSSPLITVPLGASVHEAAAVMTSNNIKRLPITKEHKIVGMLSARDLVEVYARA